MKNKNGLIWGVALFCTVIVLGALTLVTKSLLAEKELDLKQGADAYREERMRLAMWRLDTLATSIVGREDARSADELYTKELREMGQIPQPQISNLLDSVSEKSKHAKLYWSLDLSRGVADSPQVVHDFQNESQDNYRVTLETFREILQLPLSGETVGQELKDLSNKDYLRKAAPKVQELQVEKTLSKLEKKGKQTKEDYSLQALRSQATGQQTSEQVLRVKNAPAVQKKFSRASKKKRQQAVNRLADNYTAQSQWASNVLPEGAASKAQSLENAIPAEVKLTPFAPLWLDQELVLVRRVQSESFETIQGVWLDREEVVRLLLEEIVDLFPHASLLPQSSAQVRESAENAMLKLPFILDPGAQEALSSVSPNVMIDLPIRVAWIGTAVAVLAGFVMLKTVLKMSDRRAAFVSSVTHELRTPLTTFRLYSEMLSEGMVKDEQTQQQYLTTLHQESERLTHLVENVLAYSQIERGSARVQKETLPLQTLMGRFIERLHLRAAEEGMKVELVVAPEDEERAVLVDATAVEQIIFNLIDNATKYASGEGCGKMIKVEAKLQRSELQISVSDQGGGISAFEQKRLFKPFHKSAEQAAHSKPGVGLGLALCRRLARAMGGDLRFQKRAQGASFRLTVPQKGA